MGRQVPLPRQSRRVKPFGKEIFHGKVGVHRHKQGCFSPNKIATYKGPTPATTRRATPGPSGFYPLPSPA